jgi:hypothetical protein
MPATTGPIPTNPYWIAANIVAAALGISLTLLMDGRGSSLENGLVPGARILVLYIFHPVTYALVAIVFAWRAVQDRFTGPWSVFCSFIAGGVLTSLVLSLI